MLKKISILIACLGIDQDDRVWMIKKDFCKD